MKKIFLKQLKKILKILSRITIWRYKPQLVGVTGSVGKTSAKEAIKKVLEHSKKVRSSTKSFNNELGLPVAVLGDWKDTGGYGFWLKVIFVSIFRIIFKSKLYPEVLVLEYGIDRPGDMKRLLDIVRPQVSVVTAIGNLPVHVEFFSGPEAIIREKSKLVNQLPSTGFAVLNNDDPNVYGMRKNTRAQSITFGFGEESDVKVTGFETALEKEAELRFKLNYGGNFIPVRIYNTIGKVQAYAAASAASVGIIFGMNLVEISEALGGYVSPPGRLKIIEGIKNSTIIDDSYNSSPIALKEALGSLKEFKKSRKIAVLGDMMEIGKYTLEAHQEAGKMAHQIVDLLITVGSRAKFTADAAIKSGMRQKRVASFDDIRKAGIFLQDQIKKGDVILIKGSQSVRMEKIVKEVMAHPEKVGDLLVRQNPKWLAKKGMYEQSAM